MDWSSLGDWGSLGSVVGLAVSLVGLIIVGFQARGAKRSADQTRKAVVDLLIYESGNRATGVIQELKRLLHQGRWEVGYYQCHTLRELLGDVRMTCDAPEQIQGIDEALARLTDIENDLEAGIRKGREPLGADGFHASLNRIQTALEKVMNEAAASAGKSYG